MFSWLSSDLRPRTHAPHGGTPTHYAGRNGRHRQKNEIIRSEKRVRAGSCFARQWPLLLLRCASVAGRPGRGGAGSGRHSVVTSPVRDWLVPRRVASRRSRRTRSGGGVKGLEIGSRCAGPLSCRTSRMPADGPATPEVLLAGLRIAPPPAHTHLRYSVVGQVVQLKFRVGKNPLELGRKAAARCM